MVNGYLSILLGGIKRPVRGFPLFASFDNLLWNFGYVVELRIPVSKLAVTAVTFGDKHYYDGGNHFQREIYHFFPTKCIYLT